MKYIFSTLIILLIGINLMAQLSKQKGSIAVAAQTALLNGENQVNAQILFTGGYLQNGYYIGLGTGFDYYKYRTVPVFIDIKKYFGNGDRQFFIYANGGVNIAWPTTTQRQQSGWWGWNNLSQFKNGIYSDIGFGYNLFNSKKRGFFTAVGFSNKTLSESYDEQIWTGNNQPITSKRNLEYSMNRILIRFGYRF